MYLPSLRLKEGQVIKCFFSYEKKAVSGYEQKHFLTERLIFGATLVVTKILFWSADHLSLLRILIVEGHLFRFKFYLECKSTQRSGGWTSTQEDMWNPVSSFIHFSLATGFTSKSSFILGSAPDHWGNEGFQGFIQVAVTQGRFPWFMYDCYTVLQWFLLLFGSLPCDFGIL